MGELAAVLAALILVGLICFQLLLAAGVPFGHYAWGGAHQTLPRQLRIASVLSSLIYSVAAVIILEAAGIIDLIAFVELARNATWGLAGLFGLGAVMNAVSRSKPERRMALVAGSLGVLCAIVGGASHAAAVA